MTYVYMLCGECGEKSHFEFTGDTTCPKCKSKKIAKMIIAGDEPDWFSDESTDGHSQREV